MAFVSSRGSYRKWGPNIEGCPQARAGSPLASDGTRGLWGEAPPCAVGNETTFFPSMPRYVGTTEKKQKRRCLLPICFLLSQPPSHMYQAAL